MMSHSARLPFGITATFRWTDGDLSVEWQPDVPLIRNPRARRRLLAAYRVARADFVQMVAHVVGGNVAIVDLERDCAKLSAVIEPPVKQ